MNKLVSFLKDESGASAAEYALILAAGALRDAIAGAMNNAANKINNAS